MLIIFITVLGSATHLFTQLPKCLIMIITYVCTYHICYSIWDSGQLPIWHNQDCYKQQLCSQHSLVNCQHMYLESNVIWRKIEIPAFLQKLYVM